MKQTLMTLGIIIAGGILPASQGSTSFEQALAPYETIHAALAGDSIEGVAAEAEKIAAVAVRINSNYSATAAGVEEKHVSDFRVLLPEIEGAAKKLAEAENLKDARDAFGELSRPMVRWREMSTGKHKPKVVFCPMVKKPWLQGSDQIANPYFGSKMLKCGNIISE